MPSSKNKEVMARTRICTDGWTDRFLCTPPNFVCGGGGITRTYVWLATHIAHRSTAFTGHLVTALFLHKPGLGLFDKKT